MPVARPPRVRFWPKVNKGNGCWEWNASLTRFGYGAFYWRGQMRPAHRFAYEDIKGAIPDKLTIDHLCRNRSCVNPDHLEAVTQRVNVLRGQGITAAEARRTHCPLGHPYDLFNTYIRPGGKRIRDCRACKDLARQRHKAKQRRIANAHI